MGNTSGPKKSANGKARSTSRPICVVLYS